MSDVGIYEETLDDYESEQFLRIEISGNEKEGKTFCGMTFPKKIAFILTPLERDKLIPYFSAFTKEQRKQIKVYRVMKSKKGKNTIPLNKVAYYGAIIDRIAKIREKENIKTIVFDNISEFYEICQKEGLANLISYDKSLGNKSKGRQTVQPVEYSKWIYSLYDDVMEKIQEIPCHYCLISQTRPLGETTTDPETHKKVWSKKAGYEPRHKRGTGHFVLMSILLRKRPLGQVSRGDITSSGYILKKDVNQFQQDITFQNLWNLINWKAQFEEEKAVKQGNVLDKLKKGKKNENQ